MAGFTLLPVILAMSLIAAIAFLLNRDNGMNAGMTASQSDADRARYVAEAGLQAINAITQGKNCNGYTDLSPTPTPTAFGADSFTATVDPASGTPVTLTATGTTAGGASAALTRSNITVYQTPFILTLQPGAAGLDTFIRNSSNTTNYGADTSLSLKPGQDVGLVRFDLASLPAGSLVQSAQFSLFQTNSSNDTVSAFGVTRPWTEGTGAVGSGATWNTSDGVTTWTTAGGDYDPAGVAIVLPGINTWATWNLTAQTAAWAAGTLPNNGILLVASGAGSTAFASSDNLTATNRPKLVITYTTPCGALPPPPPPPPGTVVTLVASQDAWIDKSVPNTNYGVSPLKVSKPVNPKRGLVRFNLSSIPAGTVPTSATLSLWVESFTNPLDSTVTVQPVSAAWVENAVTWNKRTSTKWWSGGSFFATPAATAPISSTFTPGWVEWDVTAIAKQWLNGGITNNGILLQNDKDSVVTFSSRGATDAAHRPKLVITY